MSQARSGGDHPGSPINLGALALRLAALALRRAAFALSLAVMLSAAIASAQPPIGVEACEKITKAGFYTVDPRTLSPTSGDCLVISASNVTINLNGTIITGLGAGAGVHVMPTASNAFIEGQDATITGFADGIEIDGSKATAEHFNANGNTNAGVLLNNSHQSTVSNFTANGNIASDHINGDGVRVVKGTQNTIQTFVAHNNARYGLWLLSTTHNSVTGFDLQDDVIAGLYAGTRASGPCTSGCKPSMPPSSFNEIFNGTALKGSGSEAYGIAIDLGNNSNRVANAFSESNNAFDMFDGNPDCANNIWFAVTLGNSFPTASCIP